MNVIHSPRGSRRSLRAYLDFVKFEHTLFALPFAYGGMLLAERSWPGWTVFLWVSLAMVGARSASMALNRVIDAEIDARNPRTATREIPTGKLSKRDGLILALLGFVALALAGWALNPLTLALLPVAVFFLSAYSYMKRLTWLCHYWLGLSIGAAAAGGWIAVTGAFAPAAVALWAAVGLWIAGFDILYAMLDTGFDRRQGLHSVPARFGEPRALTVAAATHLVAWLAFALVLPLAGAGWPYALGLAGIGSLLWLQHHLVRRHGIAAVMRSFNANLWIGLVMLAAIILDLGL